MDRSVPPQLCRARDLEGYRTARVDTRPIYRQEDFHVIDERYIDS